MAFDPNNRTAELYVIEAYRWEQDEQTGKWKKESRFESRRDLKNAQACAGWMFKELRDEGYKTSIYHAFRMNYQGEGKERTAVDPPELIYYTPEAAE